VGEWIGTDGALPTLARAARSYWLGVFPDACREIRVWRARAAEIPDPALRRIALHAHGEKRGNLEGAAAFAAFTQPAGRHAAMRAVVAYQTMFDYLDNLSEEASEDPIANGRRLNRALLAAIAPGEPHHDYYALRRGEDGGYLHALIATCRTALTALPSFATIAEPVWCATERVVAYQSLNHGDGDGRHRAFDSWAQREAHAYPDLRWWETGAAAASTLGVFALIAAAANPDLESDAADAIEQTYFPWTGALTSLLDSLADREEDEATGMRGLIDYYTSPQEAADRMRTIAIEAVHRTRSLPEGRSHALILAAMTSFYLCDLSMSSSLYARLVTPAVLEAMGCLARPTMLIFSARRSTGRVTDRIAASLSRRRASYRSPHLDRGRVLESVRYSSPSDTSLENQVFDFPLV
jgi:tetraprenyl-beta-curcumene synthase